MNTIVKSFILLCMLLWNYHATAQEVWELVTDYSNLSTDDTYVIAGNSMENLDKWWTLNNNPISKDDFPAVRSLLTISDNRITSTISNDETWNIEETGISDVYFIKSTKGNYYLQYGTSTKCKITSKPTGNNLTKAQWMIHYQDSYDDGVNTYTITGLFNKEASPRRMLAIYEGTSSTNWHAESPQDYKWQRNQEVVLFRKKTTESSSISSAEYATFSSEYALDFSGEPGLTVYTAAVNEAKTKVMLREVTSKRVPANTAVVLHGSTGSYTGSIIESADEITDNQLQTATSEMSGAEHNIYVLNKKNGVVGFYKLSATGKLAKGKAYITIEGNGSAPMLSMSEDLNATTIEMLPADACQYQKSYYTLDGRRVERPTKGVYVVNGKKIIIR